MTKECEFALLPSLLVYVSLLTAMLVFQPPSAVVRSSSLTHWINPLCHDCAFSGLPVFEDDRRTRTFEDFCAHWKENHRILVQRRMVWEATTGRETPTSAITYGFSIFFTFSPCVCVYLPIVTGTNVHLLHGLFAVYWQ